MDELAAARQLLPGWVTLLPWLLGPAVGGAGFLATWAAMRLSLGPLPEGQWTERARLIHPARLVGQVSRVIHLTFALVVCLGWGASWASWPPAVPSLVVLTCAYAGPVLAALGFEARVRSLPYSRLVRSWLSVTLVANGGPAALALFIPLSRVAGAPGLAFALLGSALVVWLGVGGGLPLARGLGLARVAPERVVAAVQRASQRTGVAARGVFEIDWALANAVAFPFTRRVGFTRAAVEALDDAQLEAVAAHELGHLGEPLPSRLIRPALLTALCGVALVLPRLFQSGPFLTLGVLLLLLALLWLAGRVIRGSEREADATAKDGDGTYARALERLYQLNLTPAVLRRPGTHGHLYDRLTAAGSPPGWPRPEAPPRPPLLARLLVVLLPVTLMVTGAVVREGPPYSTFHAQLQIAFGGHRPWAPEQLARDARDSGRQEDALTYAQAAHRLSPRDVGALALLAEALGGVHRCDDAWRTLAEGQAVAGEKKRRLADTEALADASTAIAATCR